MPVKTVPPTTGPTTAPEDAGKLTSVPAMPEHASLLEITAAIVRTGTSVEALDYLYRILSERHSLHALALEYAAGPNTRLVPFGDTTLLFQKNTATVYREVVCYLEDAAAPPGQITYFLDKQSPLSEAFLHSVTAMVAMRLGQENLLKRAVEAEDKAGQRISEVAAIYEIGQAIDQIELPELLSLITYRAALLMDAQACSLMLVNEETATLRVSASHGLPIAAQSQEQRLGEGIAGRVALTEQPMLIVGDPDDPRLEGVELRPEIGSSMLVPLKGQSGTAQGVLSIRRRHPAPDFTDDDLKLFSVFATQAALAITNVRLFDDLKRRASELLKLSSLTRVLISTLDLEALLERIANDICGVVGFDRCCLFMRDTHRPLYIPRIWRGYTDAIGRNPVREGEGAVGAAARHKAPLVFDARQTQRPEGKQARTYLLLRGFARALGTDSFVAAPILTSQNKCIGVVVADNRNRRAQITQEQKNLLTAFVNQAGIVIEHLRLYEEMQESYRNIHRLKNYTDNVLQSIGAGILSTDAQGHIARWTRAAEETLHLPAEFFRNATLTEIIASLELPENEQSRLLGVVEKVVETGERIHLHKMTLHPHSRPPMTWNLMVSRLMDHNHERAGVVMIFEDVTQEIRLETELEKMRRLADIGQLAAKMAHEVRNALSPIKGAAQIIRTDLEAQGATTEWPDIIVAEVDGLSSLTSEMLDFARPSSLNLRKISVAELLENRVQVLSTFLNEHHAHILWEVPDDLPEIQGDLMQLRQVVQNILMNAVQSMPEGGELTLGAAYDPGTSMIVVRFHDRGIGIAQEDIERIFRPFVTTRTKGTGLGLPIVQKIVDQHGGRVEVKSKVGEGTCFSVFLPLTPPGGGLEVRPDEMPLISPRPVGFFPDN